MVGDVEDVRRLRVRQLRSERGLSQAALAQILDISPSYPTRSSMNDVRPLTVSVLLRITEVFGVDATFFASNDDTRLVAELREVMLDRDLDTAEVDPTAIAEMVSAHPAIAWRQVNLHRRYRITTAQLAAATEERFNSTPEAAAPDPSRCRTKKSAITSTNGRTICTNSTPPPKISPHGFGCTAANCSGIVRRLTEARVHIVKRIDLGKTVLHQYHADSRILEISNHLSAGQRAFKMAAELAYLEVGDLIDAMVTDGKFTSDESRTLARSGLANSLRRRRGAALSAVPATSARISDTTSNAFRVLSGELRTICHRLSTLQRPSMRGVPFSFVPGRQGGKHVETPVRHRLSLLLDRGTCPCGMFTDVRQPGKILVQIAEMPDGRSYMWVARTVERRASATDSPARRDRAGLRTAPRQQVGVLRGLDLSSDSATPIGSGCRVCERDNCRSAPSRSGARSISTNTAARCRLTW